MPSTAPTCTSRRTSDGPTLVLLHGGARSRPHLTSGPVFDRLADRATLVYDDCRADGRSARPADYGAELWFDNLVADTIGVIDALGLDWVTLLGRLLRRLPGPAGGDRPSGAADRPGHWSITVPAFDYEPSTNGTPEQLEAFGLLFSEPVQDVEA